MRNWLEAAVERAPQWVRLTVAVTCWAVGLFCFVQNGWWLLPYMACVLGSYWFAAWWWDRPVKRVIEHARGKTITCRSDRIPRKYRQAVLMLDAARGEEGRADLAGVGCSRPHHYYDGAMVYDLWSQRED